MPLFGLLSDAITRSHLWAGYYTTMGTNGLNPPMFFDLHLSEPPWPTWAHPNCMYFCGEGHNHVGLFSLWGECHILTGMIKAIKTYPGMFPSNWTGMLTPFGMVGKWGDSEYRGWWWIWPQEWSFDDE
jgi:hypothetical protein